MNNDRIDIVERVLQEDIDRKIVEEKRKEKLKIRLDGKNDKIILILFGIGLFLITLGICISIILKFSM